MSSPALTALSSHSSSPTPQRVETPQVATATDEPPKKKEISVADVKLFGYPEEKKLLLIKEIRKLKPGMNMMDSKKLVENLPQILQNRVAGDDLVEWKKVLDTLGAKYELIE
eukprot:TRINITY_DN5635_c0_g1_i2.p2 TRINITY_DN5635_c0_g1~~TRINITY_DN5635_c0_g1_i2.p2  ORF type:complete len:112 (-),score=27.52 TRINITY_DN5635_c0_g1_i2:110-445(-)